MIKVLTKYPSSCLVQFMLLIKKYTHGHKIRNSLKFGVVIELVGFYFIMV